MYEHKGLEDILFLMLYGGATMLAIASCLYLLFTRGNLCIADNKPPQLLRRWAAAFMASVAASHIWWIVLGIYVITDDRLLRNIVAITLDRLTFVPLMMCVLLRLLQDRKRPLWIVAVAMLPVAVISVLSIVTRNESFELYTEIYSAVLTIAFIIYYVQAMRQYNRWLCDNYADLQHKEVWQSVVLLTFILLSYACYASNEGDLFTEYIAQLNTLVIIGFVLWRVETLQELTIDTEQEEEFTPPIADTDEGISDKSKYALPSSVAYNIDSLLKQHCEAAELYLQHDLTLQQLANIIGTNRTYLSYYFAEQGVSYNVYINQLRIKHFTRLYRETASSVQPTTAKAIAIQSGFRSYVTFSVAFKKYTGYTVTEWIEMEKTE